MLRTEYGIRYPLNFDVYPRGEFDDCDLVINSWNIDIKSTRSGNWLLFEHNKLVMRSRQTIDTMPDAIFMCRTPWVKGKDEPTGKVELIGAISLEKLLSNSKQIKRLPKGSYIPNTHAKLQANNYAVHFDDLSHNWNQIINYMKKHPPCGCYRVPIWTNYAKP